MTSPASSRQEGVRLLAPLLIAVALVVAGCSGDSGGSPSGSTIGSQSPASASPSAAASGAPASASPSPSASASAAAGTFTNPVIDANFADPFILESDGTWYAYATGNLSDNIQVSTSAYLVTWSDSEEALPKLPL